MSSTGWFGVTVDSMPDWSDPERSVNGNTADYATSPGIPYEEDSVVVYNVNAWANKIRLWIHGDGAPCNGVVVYYDGQWHNLGYVEVDNQWVIFELAGVFYVEKIRLVFTGYNSQGDGYNYIHEIEAGLFDCMTIYGGQDGSIDYDNLLAAMEIDDIEVEIPDQNLPPGTIWHYTRRQVGECGLQSNPSPPCIVQINPAGEMVGSVPNVPDNLELERLAGGKFRLRWRYTPLDADIAPDGFHVYIDDGGGFDWDLPDAEVAYLRNNREYSWESGSLMDGVLYHFCVRSYHVEDGVTYESQNTAFVADRADSQGPDAISGLLVSVEEMD